MSQRKSVVNLLLYYSDGDTKPIEIDGDKDSVLAYMYSCMMRHKFVESNDGELHNMNCVRSIKVL